VSFSMATEQLLKSILSSMAGLRAAWSAFGFVAGFTACHCAWKRIVSQIVTLCIGLSVLLVFS